MSKVGIELSIEFDKMNDFIQDVMKLEKKYGIQAHLDEKNNVINFKLLDLLQVKTKQIERKTKQEKMMELMQNRWGCDFNEKEMD